MQETMIGNTHIIFNDMCCRNQTTDQCAQILQNVSNIAYAEMIRKGRKDEAV
ncbi:MAG: hypothetical protein KH452_06080 [Clostridiales bacterium]|nr:hypothetical protein [Clostridiales bacterium]